CYLCHTHDLHVPFPTRRSSDLTQDDPSNISTETHICGMSTDYMPIEEREANAALIAAAPDMYEALKQAKREMWDMARHQWALSDFKNWAVIQQIDAALAKARAAKAEG